MICATWFPEISKMGRIRGISLDEPSRNVNIQIIDAGNIYKSASFKNDNIFCENIDALLRYYYY